MEQVKISIIMLNWNSPEMTIEAVNSILISTFKNIVINIIDNGSLEHNYLKLVNRFKHIDKVLIFRSSKNLGYAQGISYGFRITSFQNPNFFLVINNDVELHNEALEHLIHVGIKHNYKALVTGKVYDYYTREKLQTVGNRFNEKELKSIRIGNDELDIGQYDKEEEREMIDDIFMLIPFKLYKDIGGYSKYFFLNYEQTDFILRAKTKGYYCIYTPKAILFHKGSFSTGGLGNAKMMFWESKSKIILHKLHQSAFSFYIFYSKYLLSIIYGILKALVAYFIGKNTNLKARFALLVGFIFGTIWVFNPKPDKGFNPFIK